MKMPRQAVCVSSSVIWLVMPIDFLYNVGYLSYASPKDRKERAFEMDRDTMIVTMLGTRGSVSVSGEVFHVSHSKMSEIRDKLVKFVAVKSG